MLLFIFIIGYIYLNSSQNKTKESFVMATRPYNLQDYIEMGNSQFYDTVQKSSDIINDIGYTFQNIPKYSEVSKVSAMKKMNHCYVGHSDDVLNGQQMRTNMVLVLP